MKKLTFLVMALLSFNVISFSQNERAQDSLALVAFFNSTNGPNWINHTGWLETNVPINHWFGVTVENNRVTEIKISNNNLSGALPVGIGQLNNIRTLHVDNNSLSGTIPDELWNLIQLYELRLGENQLSGSISNKIGQLQNLHYLVLLQNQFTGMIPSEIGQLTNLRQLYLSFNQFSGTIPTTIGNLIYLQWLGLSYNNLTGNIPLEVGNLKELITLEIGQNQLSGTIPIQIGMMNNLWYLQLFNNQLTGAIPTELGALTNLRNITLANNNLTGIIPDGLCDISMLQSVAFNNNNFDEQSCPTIQCLKDKGVNFEWDYRQLQQNGFSLTNGCIYNPVSEQDSLALVAFFNATNGPGWSNNQNWNTTEPVSKWYGVTIENERVIRLELWNNNLSGYLPAEIGDLTGLRELYLGGNQIAGQIPAVIGDLINLQSVQLNGNQFSGNIPTTIGDLSNLYYLSLSENQLTGNIPFQIGQLSNLESLTLANNQLMGEIPAELGLLSNLRWIQLYNNSLSGIIPDGLCDISTLEQVNFQNNYFDDQSCPTIKCLKENGVNFDWDYRQLQKNDFSLTNGCIYNPVSETDSLALVAFYTATNGENWSNNLNWNTAEPVSKWNGVTIENERVIRLELNNNNLTGYLPVEIGDLTGLRELYLGGNQITGQIPAEIGDLITLQSVQLNGNQFSGNIPTTIGELSNLYYLSLSENQLTGNIPVQIGQLSNLDGLTLANNQLLGEIPVELGLLTNLRWIQLYNNSLSGIIPDGLCDISTLEQVNFQDNYFDDQSCPTIKCLKENGVNFDWDYRQLQKNGFSLTNGCIYNPVSETDSLALVAFYDATNGPGWSNNQHWNTTEPVSKWYGITIENERVIRLELWNNNLSGYLPAEIGDLTGLRELYLGGNQITGQIPAVIGDLINLQSVQLNGNQFSGNIPTTIGELSNLYYLSLSENQLTGNIPVQIGQLSNLDGLTLANNQLLGEIPVELGLLTNLRWIQLYNNSLSGIIPERLCDISTLEQVNFQDNYFDDQSCPTIKCLKDNGVNFEWDYRQLQKNGFSLTNGCIYNPVSAQDSLALVAFYTATNGENWSNNLNWNTAEPVSKWYGVTIENEQVIRLELWNNNLSGYLPVETGDLTGLRELYLGDNQITGQIPSEIGDLFNLQLVQLNGNQFSGNIPTTIGDLSNLYYLSLSENQLTGNIPVQIGQLSNLEGLTLANNQLLGEIPLELGQLTKLRNLYLYSNLLSGVVPIELCNIVSLEEISLFDNLFDEQSCEGFQCLIDKDLIFGLGQSQKNGFVFPTYCNPNINRSLVITESRMDNMNEAYVEITNMGDNPVQLSEYEFGTIRPWASPWNPEPNRTFLLPDHVLQPGESYTITVFSDFGPEQWLTDPDNYPERATKEEWEDIADLQFHIQEPKGDWTDEIIGDYWFTFDVWNGRECWFLRQHLSETEAVVVDQVGGVFDSPEGRNFDKSYEVAGVPGATGNSILVRKYSVKNGNINFADARGVGPNDSEWMPVPRLSGAPEPWRSVFWTAGNHGDYSMDETTLVSNTLTVDWQNKIIYAPWGTGNNDDFMREFEYSPGLAWYYHLSEGGDNLYHISARTGDRITIYACGNDMDEATFDIVVNEPTSAENIVIPKHRPAGSSFLFGFGFNPAAGEIDWPRVTNSALEMDSITGSYWGIPFATRTDTLLKYLEKAPNASWEIVFADGIQKAEIRNGDILIVTAENKDVKEYYIQVQAYRPAHQADLATIIWPGIPAEFIGTNGWNSDTIPNFSTHLYEYTVSIPHNFAGTPVFVPIPVDKKAKYTTTIINPLSGNIANKTIEFTVTAEDGYTMRIYRIHLNKLKDPADIQPFAAEPFLSELIFWEQWSNSFGEICNPGTEPLDLSNYMIAMQFDSDPNNVIQSRMAPNEWLDRYDKYVPGYKWVNEEQWQKTPGLLMPDPNVNPIIQPGDVFAFGGIWADAQTAPAWLPNYVWPVPSQLDLQFNMLPNNSNKRDFPNGFSNPWGEPISNNGSPIRKWSNSSWYMFKILNDSVKLGLKPANDPDDFELIETFGMGDVSDWVIGGIRVNMITNYMRKPEIFKGNPIPKGSFGTNPDDTEWTWTNQQFWQSQNVGWPMEILNVVNDLGNHNLKEITEHQSVVYSDVYKVSPGYSLSETVTGIVTGIIAGDFLANIIKGNEGQTLTITANLDGAVLNMTDILSNEDVLTVLSADGTNTTQYIIGVSDEGFSNDTEITPVDPEIVIVQDNTLTGFEYGTTIETVIQNIVVPEGATVTILDANNNPIPYSTLNYQGEYVDVTVNANITVIVTAEDGITEMVYDMEPVFAEGEIFVASDYFEINQEDLVVGTVEPGTTVEQLLANLFTIPGATIQIVDKFGVEKTTGPLYPDDKLIVTYDENTYYGLKALAEPLVKVYNIFICDTPVSEMLKHITVELDINGEATVGLGDISDPTVGGCGAFWLNLLNSNFEPIEKVDFNCSNLGVNKIMVALFNIFGRVSTSNARVTVIDNIAPEAICKTVTIYLNSEGKATLSAELIDNGSNDVCGIKSFNVSKKEFDCSNLGENDVIFSVEDMGGNISNCLASVIVEYLSVDLAKCKPITIQLDTDGNGSLLPSDVFHGKADNCLIQSLEFNETNFDCNDLGVYNSELTLVDINNNQSTCNADVTIVDLIPPVVNVTNVTDVPLGELMSTITYSDNCSVESVTNDAPSVFSSEITYVTWTVKDLSGNIATAVQEVTTTNLPPIIHSIDAPIEPFDKKETITVSANYEDINLESAVWDWGDGTTTSSVDFSDGIITGEHSYFDPGVYVLTLTITDVYGLTAALEHRYIVIFDPDGAFVTGGGWIDSPVGASIQYPEATGKAEFGFVSKYKKGTSIPTGNTEFKFQAGNLFFKSTEYDWLVIAGTKAMFKGKGTINGLGNYGFMISAIDGDLKPRGGIDLFRMKIWDNPTNEIVYDNQLGDLEDIDPVTSVGGGSIIIHNPNYKSGLVTSSKELLGLNPAQFKIYPNPTSKIVKIDGFDPIRNYAVKIIGMDGREFMFKQNNSPEMEINISNLPAGIYNLLIQLEGKSISFQVIKK